VSEIHDAAVRGLGAAATANDRARPSYPQDAVAWLADRLGIKPGRQVVDLAAGTGKLTAQLADAGADLVAVEPIASMRDLLRVRLPGIPVLGGVAEAIPLADKSVDAVVVAQAFQWFDTRRALDEIARVVRPGGSLGLIWNAKDRSPEWVDQVWSVMDRVKPNVPRLAGPTDSNWSPWTESTFFHEHHRVDAVFADRLG
jgi:ubiquinone/menaquinone biosynthesis C-methylase UbiE